MISLLMDPQRQETLATFSCPSPIETSPGQRCRRNHWRWVGGNHPVWLGTWLGTLFVSTISWSSGLQKCVTRGASTWIPNMFSKKAANQQARQSNVSGPHLVGGILLLFLGQLINAECGITSCAKVVWMARQYRNLRQSWRLQHKSQLESQLFSSCAFHCVMLLHTHQWSVTPAVRR